MSQSPLSSHPGVRQARGPFAAAVRAHAAQHPAHVHTYQILERCGLAVALVEYSTTHPDYEGGLRVEAFRGCGGINLMLPGSGVECIEFMNAGGLEELVDPSTYYLKVGEVDSLYPSHGGQPGYTTDYIEELIAVGDIDLGAYLQAALIELAEEL
mgnify:CR=1 FL=1